MIKTPHYRRFLLVLFFFLSGMAFAAVPKITQVRVSDSAEMTRFVFDLSAPVKNYHISYHPGAKGLSLDVDNLTSATSFPKSLIKNTPVTNYSAQALGKNNVRLNFDLAATVDPKVFVLSPTGNYGYRLVLDLKKQVPAASFSVPVASTGRNMAVIQNQEAIPEPNPAALQPQLVSPKKSSSRPLVIVIDPGHGGKDPGAVGPAGNREKMVVLQISMILRDMINKEKGYKAVLTRDRDVYIPLRQRLEIARRNKADFFVSIHADAYKNRSVKGASVFALSERGATSEMARWIAQKENESELLDGVYASNDKVLRSVLLDLSQTYAISTSLDMGRNILGCLDGMTSLHSRRVEQAAFVVLKSPDIPSLLVETGFISNPTQEKELMSKSYQTKIAQAIVRGVKDYFAKHPREGR